MPYDVMGRPLQQPPGAGMGNGIMGQQAGPMSQMGDPGTFSPGSIDDPQIRAMLLGAYGDQMEMDDLDRQLGIANTLRDTPMPEGRQAGRVYTAANPLEFVGSAMKQYQGYKQSKELEAERAEVRRRLAEAVRTYGSTIPYG